MSKVASLSINELSHPESGKQEKKGRIFPGKVKHMTIVPSSLYHHREHLLSVPNRKCLSKWLTNRSSVNMRELLEGA